LSHFVIFIALFHVFHCSPKERLNRPEPVGLPQSHPLFFRYLTPSNNRMKRMRGIAGIRSRSSKCRFLAL
jgi:hypothetical protein